MSGILVLGRWGVIMTCMVLGLRFGTAPRFPPKAIALVTWLYSYPPISRAVGIGPISAKLSPLLETVEAS